MLSLPAQACHEHGSYQGVNETLEWQPLMPLAAVFNLIHELQVGDLHIRVDRATCKRADGGGSVTADGPEGVEYVRARSIFVGNLHFDVQDEELIRIFSDAAVDPELAGAVTAVRVVRDRATNVGKGVAFVEVRISPT